MNKLYNLRIYPKDSDVYNDDDGYYIDLQGKHTLKECGEIIDNLAQYRNSSRTPPVPWKEGEIVAVDEQGNKYFSPRDGFDWMDVTKVGDI